MRDRVAPDTPALVIDDVSKIYLQWQRSGKLKDVLANLIRPRKKTVTALDRLSLEVRQGEFVAYAGANGAGKSTTIKILSGILQPTSGTVRVLGLNPAGERIDLMRRIGVLFGQRSELWWDHPVIVSYEWKKNVWNVPEKAYAENLAVVTELLDLSDLLQTFARELSLGQRMRADLGMLLLHSPEVIFLDEPTLGLDVLAKRQMIRFLRSLNREKGTTIVVTSHDMDDLEEMAERIVLLSAGRILYDGDFDRLRRVRGGFSRISITASAEPPVLPGMKLLRTEKGVHEYESTDDMPGLQQIFHELARHGDIVDIEVGKAPIEDVIANLYLEEQDRRKE